MKHLYAKGYVITECGLTHALPDTCTSDLANVTCADCKKVLLRRGICTVCGEQALSWGTHPRSKTGVVDGRLTANDVETIFYLACDYCSETLIARVDPDDVAAALSHLRWLP